MGGKFLKFFLDGIHLSLIIVNGDQEIFKRSEDETTFQKGEICSGVSLHTNNQRTEVRLDNKILLWRRK